MFDISDIISSSNLLIEYLLEDTKLARTTYCIQRTQTPESDNHVADILEITKAPALTFLGVILSQRDKS